MTCVTDLYYDSLVKKIVESAFITYLTTRNFGYSINTLDFDTLTSRINTEVPVPISPSLTVPLPPSDYDFSSILNRHLIEGTRGFLTFPIDLATNIDYVFEGVQGGVYNLFFFAGFVGTNGSMTITATNNLTVTSVLHPAGLNNSLGPIVPNTIANVNADYGTDTILTPDGSIHSLIDDFGTAIHVATPTDITISFLPDTVNSNEFVFADRIYLIKTKLGQIFLPDDIENVKF